MAAPMLPTTTLTERALKPHEVVLSPTIQNVVGVHAWSKFAGEADLGETVVDLREQVREVQAGDMGRDEAILHGQANISNGPQQVNNGTGAQPGQPSTKQNTHSHAHAKKNEAAQNELLEHQHGNVLDTGTQSTPGGTNRELEAMATGHRTTHP